MINVVHLRMSDKDAVEIIPDQFISLALDASQIIGGFWWDHSNTTAGGLGNNRVEPLDLTDTALIKRTAALNPYCIRIGGTEADRLFYSVKKKKKQLTEGYQYRLGKRKIRELNEFCTRTGSSLMITLNAGPGPRKNGRKWKKRNARHLIEYSDSRNMEVKVWELGNEVNAYPFFLGLSHRVSPAEYAGDIQKLSRIIPEGKGIRTAGPALAVWPVLGETLPFMKRFLKNTEICPDIITWHYYPQQSSRCPMTVRKAKRKTLLNPRNLNEVRKQLKKLKKLRDRYHPRAEMWLGETGHALCGGEKGLSDTFYSGFWWLDQICLMAVMGQKQVVRQTLTGGDYGLLDKEDHFPLPDYWTTLLFNRYAGCRVYSLQPPGHTKLRLYLHSLKGDDLKFCLIFISLEEKHDFLLKLAPHLPPVREKIILTTRDIYSRQIQMNGRELTPATDPDHLVAEKTEPADTIYISPLSYGFYILY